MPNASKSQLHSYVSLKHKFHETILSFSAARHSDVFYFILFYPIPSQNTLSLKNKMPAPDLLNRCHNLLTAGVPQFESVL